MENVSGFSNKVFFVEKASRKNDNFRIIVEKTSHFFYKMHVSVTLFPTKSENCHFFGDAVFILFFENFFEKNFLRNILIFHTNFKFYHRESTF